MTMQCDAKRRPRQASPSSVTSRPSSPSVMQPSHFSHAYEDTNNLTNIERTRCDSFKENVPLLPQQARMSRHGFNFGDLSSAPLSGACGGNGGRTVPTRHRRPLSEIDFETVVARAL